jgi:uncharacterized protein (DUF1501 family)
MKRKTFLLNTAMATAMYPLLNLMQACHSSRSSLPHKRILVLVQLVGGNDGLNTLIPLTNYKNLVAARPNLFIPEKKVLSLNGYRETGLHPALGGIQDLFNNGLAGFVQNVGYDNQSYSHFRSSDVWLTGSTASEVLYTGWMARYLETRYKDYPLNFPNSEHPHPPAIKVGDTGTFAFQSEEMDMSIVINSFSQSEHSGTEEDRAAPDTYGGKQANSIRKIFLQSDRYNAAINNALNTSFQHTPLYPKPGENPLADQLKTVARLIHAGLDTPVYMVDLKGFDTHAEQVDPSNTTKGAHADLLAKLSQAITCFWEDIEHMDRQDDVAGMAFSEFGRRIIANHSYGTDHGAAQPLLFFGAALKGGIVGHNPLIPDQVTVDDNLNKQYDFRSIYTSILNGWYKAEPKQTSAIFSDTFPSLQLFKT